MRLAHLFVVASVAVLAAAAVAPAKEGARARLATTLPLDAAPATRIRVGWTVHVMDDKRGRVPFNAIGMFVRLLSATGARSTTAFASATAHPDGRYAADAVVPAGGVGGVRIGLRGTTDVLFPVDNDPFTSAGGARCDVAAVRAKLAAFVRAYNLGDARRLDRLFSHERYVWYSSGRPGIRRGRDARNRDTLLRYFRERHRRGDRLALVAWRFNGYASELGHFELAARRRADDFRGGRWFAIAGKGALDCSRPPVTIAALSVGGPPGQ